MDNDNAALVDPTPAGFLIPFLEEVSRTRVPQESPYLLFYASDLDPAFDQAPLSYIPFTRDGRGIPLGLLPSLYTDSRKRGDPKISIELPLRLAIPWEGYEHCMYHTRIRRDENLWHIAAEIAWAFDAFLVSLRLRTSRPLTPRDIRIPQPVESDADPTSQKRAAQSFTPRSDGDNQWHIVSGENKFNMWSLRLVALRRLVSNVWKAEIDYVVDKNTPVIKGCCLTSVPLRDFWDYLREDEDEHQEPLFDEEQVPNFNKLSEEELTHYLAGAEDGPSIEEYSREIALCGVGREG